MTMLPSDPNATPQDNAGQNASAQDLINKYQYLVDDGALSVPELELAALTAKRKKMDLEKVLADEFEVTRAQLDRVEVQAKDKIKFAAAPDQAGSVQEGGEGFIRLNLPDQANSVQAGGEVFNQARLDELMLDPSNIVQTMFYDKDGNWKSYTRIAGVLTEDVADAGAAGMTVENKTYRPQLAPQITNLIDYCGQPESPRLQPGQVVAINVSDVSYEDKLLRFRLLITFEVSYAYICQVGDVSDNKLQLIFEDADAGTITTMGCKDPFVIPCDDEDYIHCPGGDVRTAPTIDPNLDPAPQPHGASIQSSTNIYFAVEMFRRPPRFSPSFFLTACLQRHLSNRLAFNPEKGEVAICSAAPLPQYGIQIALMERPSATALQNRMWLKGELVIGPDDVSNGGEQSWADSLFVVAVSQYGFAYPAAIFGSANQMLGDGELVAQVSHRGQDAVISFEFDLFEWLGYLTRREFPTRYYVHVTSRHYRSAILDVLATSYGRPLTQN